MGHDGRLLGRWGGGRTRQVGLFFWDLDIARKTSRIGS